MIVMTEYIERGVLDKALTIAAVNDKGKSNRTRAEAIRRTWAKAIRVLHNLPSADVAPVVRCRDCRYYRVSAILAPNKFCFRLKHPVEDRPIGYNFAPDDFCSHGERKDGGRDGK